MKDLPTWLNRNEYPFQSRFYNCPAGRMHYVDEGQGEPIVFVHGNPTWSFSYREIIKALSKTHRCLAVDHLGFGLSDKPVGWDYLPVSHAANFEAWIESLHLSGVTLVVNDWGGPIAISYAIRHPEKIKKIVVLNSWMWSVKGDPHFERFSGMMGGAIGNFLIKHFNFFARFFLSKTYYDPKKLTKSIHRQLYQHLDSKDDRAGCCVFPREIIGSSTWLDSLWENKRNLAPIAISLVWGMKDIAFREKELHRWTIGFPNAKVVAVQRAGHYPEAEAPEVVIRELSLG